MTRLATGWGEDKEGSKNICGEVKGRRSKEEKRPNWKKARTLSEEGGGMERTRAVWGLCKDD